MATVEQIKAALKVHRIGFRIEERYPHDGNHRLTACILVASGTIDHDEMRLVAVALQTEAINVEHSGEGCDTCGYGASLDVEKIPHPFPCAECQRSELTPIQDARDDDLFCCDEHRDAYTVRDALEAKGWD